MLPAGFFVVTTPQNLAYLFFLLVLFLGLNCRGYSELILLYVLSTAALATHPVAGIPALLFVFTIDRIP